MAYNFPCDWHSGFAMDPTRKMDVGYLTDFKGLGMSAALAKDLTVFTPYNNTTAPAYTPLTITNNTVTVTAVLESVSWAGDVASPFVISCYMSQENAMQLKSLKKNTLTNTGIDVIGWWICSFDDQSTKSWFEKHHPMTPFLPTGQLNAVGKDVRLYMADDGVKVAPTVELKVYNVHFEMVPAAQQTATFHVAESPTMKNIYNWGLVVGTLPASAVKPVTS